MDQISAMLGLGLDDEQKARLMADQLRGRKQAADFFGMTTIPQIAQGAQQEGQDIMDSAQRGGALRSAMAQRDMTQGYYDQMREQSDRNYDLRKEENQSRADDNALKRTIEIMKLQGTPEQQATPEYTQPKTKDERAAFDKGASDASAMLNLKSTFKDDFGIKKGDVPWTGDLTNWLGRTVEGVAPEEWGEKALWWSDYKNRAELVQRHELFGSALTRTEQGEWQKATIGPNDGPKYIREKLAVRARLAKKVAEADAARALQRGYDPKQVLMNYGDAVDVEALIPRVADGSYFEDLAKKQEEDRKSALTDPAGLPTLDPIGGDVPSWTPEKMSRLEELRAKRDAGEL